MLLSFLFISIFPYVQSYVTCKGIVALDDVTFRKVLCHHSVCLVLFHEKYGYNKIEKEFEKFAQLVAEQPNILVAEVGTTDWGEQENHSIREKYGISVVAYPKVLLFHKDNLENPTPYKGEVTSTNLAAWLEEITGISIDDQPSILKVRTLSKKFYQAFLESTIPEEELKNLIKDVDSIAKEIKLQREKESAVVYTNIMKKMLAKGRDYITNEHARLKSLLRKGEVTKDKKVVFKRKLDILKEFIKFTEELNH